MDRETFWLGLGAVIKDAPIGKIPGGVTERWRIDGFLIGFVRVLPNGTRDCYLSDPADPDDVRLEMLIEGWNGLKKATVGWEDWEQWYGLSGKELRAAVIAAIVKLEAPDA